MTTGLRAKISFPVLMIAVAMGLAGCSWTFPGMKSETVSQKLADDDITTGSIKPKQEAHKPITQLKNLTEEDWRRARAALEVAVDPHGSTDRVLWDNPQTLAKGSFAPDGAPFVKNDEVCRNFKTHVTDPTETQNLVGTACRPSGGEWDITELKSAPAAKAPDNKAKVTAAGKPVVKPVPAKPAPKQVAKAAS